jgi:copper chaperone CopZ
MEKLNLKVTGMSCAHCEKNLTNAMEDLGVKVIRVSAAEGVAELEHDPSKVTVDAIKAEIVEIGYEVA